MKPPKVLLLKTGKKRSKPKCRMYYYNTFENFSEAKNVGEILKNENKGRFYILATGELFNREHREYHLYCSNEVSLL